MLRLPGAAFMAARRDLFFTVSFIAAAATCFFSAPKIEYIDFKLLAILLELMLIIKAFEEYSVLGWLSGAVLKSCPNERALARAMCLASFALSMLVTNDVALLTVVPLLLDISRRSSFKAVIPAVLVTIAANLGSAATPIGNPQNLYLFSRYGMSAGEFFSYSLPLGAAGLALVLALTLFVKPMPICYTIGCTRVGSKPKAAVFAVCFMAAVLSVFGIIPYWAALAAVIAAAALLKPALFKRADYKLLFTFVCFFIAAGNISAIPAVKQQLSALMGAPESAYAVSMLASQLISNVPAAVLLSPFTEHARAVFYGVNIGGLGTVIASLASVITYRLYAREYPEGRRGYMKKFSALNFASLAVLGAAFLLLV